MEELKKFILSCGYFFIATIDGDQPRVRPFAAVNIFEGKLYIMTGKFKNVSKQIEKNPKVEICAISPVGDEWVRVRGTLVRDERYEAKADLLSKFPSLSAYFKPDDDRTEVLYFKDAVASYYTFDYNKEPRVVKF